METSWSQKTEPDLVKCWQHQTDSSAARHAAAELLGRYQQRVYRWCFGYVKDHDRALDLAQDVLLTSLQKIATLKTETRFANWLFVVTRNCCLGEMRKHKVRTTEDLDIDNLPSSSPTPETDFLDRVSEEQLLEIMVETLEKPEQDAIYLRCFEKMPVDSITTVLGIKDSSGARGVLQRARRKLKIALTDQGYDLNKERGPS